MVRMSAMASAVRMKFVGERMCLRVSTTMLSRFEMMPNRQTATARYPCIFYSGGRGEGETFIGRRGEK